MPYGLEELAVGVIATRVPGGDGLDRASKFVIGRARNLTRRLIATTYTPAWREEITG
jgi:hypothetical protein